MIYSIDFDTSITEVNRSAAVTVTGTPNLVTGPFLLSQWDGYKLDGASEFSVATEVMEYPAYVGFNFWIKTDPSFTAGELFRVGDGVNPPKVRVEIAGTGQLVIYIYNTSTSSEQSYTFSTSVSTGAWTNVNLSMGSNNFIQMHISGSYNSQWTSPPNLFNTMSSYDGDDLYVGSGSAATGVSLAILMYATEGEFNFSSFSIEGTGFYQYNNSGTIQKIDTAPVTITPPAAPTPSVTTIGGGVASAPAAPPIKEFWS